MRKLHNYKFYKPLRKNLRNNMTKAEVLLWIYLKNSQLGFKFRRQQSIGHYIADFYCPEVGLVIELDGEAHAAQKAKIRDQNKEKFLKNNGFIVKRYTNQQIFENLEYALDEIKKLCNGLRTRTTPNPSLERRGTNAHPC